MNEKKKTICIAIVMLCLGIMLGKYLFSGANIDDYRNTVGTIRKQQQQIDELQQNAVKGIERAEKASANIADGIERIESSAVDSTNILEQNDRIYKAIRKQNQGQ